MSPEPFVSRAKALSAKRNEKGYGDENANDIVTANASHNTAGSTQVVCIALLSEIVMKHDGNLYSNVCRGA